METLANDLFRAWPQRWQMPALWAATIDSSAPVPLDAVVQAVMASIVDPMSVSEAVLELLRLGEFHAASRLLASDDAGVLTAGQRKLLDKRLREAKIEARQTVDERSVLLQRRHRRLATPNRETERWMEEARLQVVDRLADAEVLLDEAERVIGAAEQDETAYLESRLANHPAYPEEGRWKNAIRRALMSRDFPTARWLLDNPNDSGRLPSHALPPRRPRWRFPVSDETFVRWIRGAPDALPGFLAAWGIPTENRIGWDLLDALEPFLPRRVAAASDQDVRRLVDVLERCLGVQRALGDEVQVGVHDGAYWTRLRGLNYPGFHAFTEAGFPDGIRFAVEALGGSNVAPVRVDPEDPSAPGRDEGFVQEPYIHFGSRPRRWPTAGAVRLEPHDLFGLIADPNQRVNLVRAIGRNLPPGQILPAPLPAPDGTFLVGRLDEQVAVVDADAPVLWIGPAGCGRTSLLRYAVTACRNRGWVVVELSPAMIGDGGLESVLDAMRVDAPRSFIDEDPPLEAGAGVLVVADDLDKLMPAAARTLAHTLHEIQRLSGGRVRCLAAAGLPVGWWLQEELGLSSRVLRPLSYEASCELVTHVLDLAGVRLHNQTVLDRLAFYADGNPGLLYRLLWGAIRLLGEREPGRSLVLYPESVEAAFGAPEFRSAAQQLVFAPVQSQPVLRAILGALLLEQADRVGTKAGTTPEGIAQWTEIYDLGLSNDQVSAGLARLEEASLVSVSEIDMHLRTSGIGLLVSELLGDGSDYLQMAAQDFAGSGGVLPE